MPPKLQRRELISHVVTLLLVWIAPQGPAAELRIEAAKEALNRACQHLSIQGHWAWLARFSCIFARCSVALQSEVALLDDLTPRGWDYGRPTRSVLDSLGTMSGDTAAHWMRELQATSQLLDDFATHLITLGEHEIWTSIKHAADGCRDLHDLVGVHVTRVSTIRDPPPAGQP